MINLLQFFRNYIKTINKNHAIIIHKNFVAYNNIFDYFENQRKKIKKNCENLIHKITNNDHEI